MITIHQFKEKYFLTEQDAPAAGGAPPAGGDAAGLGATPPAGAGAGTTPPADLGGLGGSLGGATPPLSAPGGDLSGLGGGIGATATGAAQTPITDIKKLNAWDLLEKYFSDKVKPEDPLEAYL